MSATELPHVPDNLWWSQREGVVEEIEGQYYSHDDGFPPFSERPAGTVKLGDVEALRAEVERLRSALSVANETGIRVVHERDALRAQLDEVGRVLAKPWLEDDAYHGLDEIAAILKREQAKARAEG